MARIVVAGAGAIGASVAYHLALKGASDVVLVERNLVASGSTGKALGGVRQQFSTAAEVRLVQESIHFFQELGPPYFHQVGYLFFATSGEGMEELAARRAIQSELGVPVESVTPERIAELAPGVRVSDVVGGVYCGLDGLSDPSSVTHELVRRAAALGVEVREGTDAREVEGDVLVIACGAHSPQLAAELGVELPIRPLCRQLLETEEIERLPERLPMVVDTETGFHFRRRGDSLLVAMGDARPRWGLAEVVDDSVIPDRLTHLAHRYPPAARARAARAWAGLYDMTPDAHPIIGRVADGVFAACGFSGHGFMQAPAAGRALAEEILDGASAIDLSPYRLERFSQGATFAESVIL